MDTLLNLLPKLPCGVLMIGNYVHASAQALFCAMHRFKYNEAALRRPIGAAERSATGITQSGSIGDANHETEHHSGAMSPVTA